MPNVLAEALVRIAADKQKMLQDLAGVKRTLGQKAAEFGRHMTTQMGRLFNLRNVLLGGLAGMGFSKIMGAYATQEQAERRLEAVIRATGNAAGYSAQELKKMAADLQQVTRYGDEVTMGAQAMLLSFKSIKGDVFKDALTTSMDLAEVMGTDLKSAVLQVGKALEDPTIGLTAMRRSGVSFTQAQTEMIKGLVESGQKLKAQKMILAEVKTQVGGAAQSTGKYGLAIAKMTNALGDLAERIGQAVAPAVSFLANGIRVLADAIGTQVIAQTLKWVTILAGGAGAVWALGKVVAGVKALIVMLKSLATKITFVQALSGPAGWAALGLGIAGAVIAIGALSRAWDNVADAAETAETAQMRAAGVMERQRYAKALQERAEAQDEVADAEKTLAAIQEGVGPATGMARRIAEGRLKEAKDRLAAAQQQIQAILSEQREREKLRKGIGGIGTKGAAAAKGGLPPEAFGAGIRGAHRIGTEIGRGLSDAIRKIPDLTKGLAGFMQGKAPYGPPSGRFAGGPFPGVGGIGLGIAAGMGQMIGQAMVKAQEQRKAERAALPAPATWQTSGIQQMAATIQSAIMKRHEDRMQQRANESLVKTIPQKLDQLIAKKSGGLDSAFSDEA